MNTPYEITVTEPEENDACHIAGRFTTLDAASAFIQEYWQDVDHIIDSRSFCTDYAIYTLIGFSLDDIGTFVEEADKNWQSYFFNPIDEEGFEEALEIIYKRKNRIDDNTLEGRSKPRKDPDAKLTCGRCGSDDLDGEINTPETVQYHCRHCGYELAS